MQAKTRRSAPRIYLGLILTIGFALAAPLAANASAALVMEPFANGPATRDTTPTFTGTSEDHFDFVTVNIYAGERATGVPVRRPGGLPAALTGKWSASVGLPLEDGTYTAVAEQPHVVDGTSVTPPYTFVVDTQAPTVTLNPLPSRSNDTTPSFSGTASDTTPVTVDVYRGGRAEGAPLATLKALGTGGSWASANVTPPLQDGEYTAVARQPSSLGNPTGVSNPVSFQIDTQPPSVTLDAPAPRSNDATPSFSGTASETTPVTVEVFEGPKPEGRIVATATATPSFGGWTSAHATPALGNGVFTALATEPSAIGNRPGKSDPVTFVVDTAPPSVTLNAPAPRSNDTTPSFSGKASETTPVTVEVFEGTKPEGRVAAKVTATPANGNWASHEVSPSLGDGVFTALATEPSAIGNGPGTSEPVTFVVDTKAPTVTLDALPSPSARRAPRFSGTASDYTPVTVEVYSGATAEGAVVSSATTEANGGGWVSGEASPPLEWGEYTAVARQPSSLGNPTGASSPVGFVVAPIPPAVATETASSVTRSSAALYASVNPHGAPVSGCYFQYGTTTSYGTGVECGFVSELSAFAPSETSAVPVFARIYGLRPSTTYHFRIVAIGEGGTGEGGDATFTTLAPWEFEEPGKRAVAPSGPAAHIAAGRLRALIARQLTPRGRGAKIGALLKSGVFKTVFKAPEAGRVALAWKYQPPTLKPPRHGAGSAVARALAPVLVATGGRAFAAAGKAVLETRLTAAGRRLLRHSSKVRLTAVCLFTPTAARPVRTSVSFGLTR